MMKLSSNFQLSEFVDSETATKNKIDNTPDAASIENMRVLCVRLLQPLREAIGEHIVITSGYRCQALNKAVGGVDTSDHQYGRSADVKTSNPRKLLAKLLELRLDYDQAILYPTFLHLSYRSGANRKQVLYAKGVKP